jgi:sulfite exporter TauE/SafE
MSNTLANYSNPFVAAMAVGLSCGTTCSPLVTLFLTTYTIGRFNNMRQGLRAFGYFWAGKMAVVCVLAFLSAVLGRAIIGQNGQIVSFDPRLVMDGCLILTGSCLLAGMFWGKRKTSACSDCNASCRRMADPIPVKGRWALVAMGVAYGITPCAPLLLLLLIVAMLPPVPAIGAGLVFSIANSVSPLLVQTTLAGFVSQKTQQEIPQLMRIFQITVCVFFIILGVLSLIGHQ